MNSSAPTSSGRPLPFSPIANPMAHRSAPPPVGGDVSQLDPQICPASNLANTGVLQVRTLQASDTLRAVVIPNGYGRFSKPGLSRPLRVYPQRLTRTTVDPRLPTSDPGENSLALTGSSVGKLIVAARLDEGGWRMRSAILSIAVLISIGLGEGDVTLAQTRCPS